MSLDKWLRVFRSNSDAFYGTGTRSGRGGSEKGWNLEQGPSEGEAGDRGQVEEGLKMRC